MKYEYIVPDIVGLLAQENIPYDLINPASDEGVAVSEWIERNFPIDPSGRIDWQAVTGAYCYSWLDDEELVGLFRYIVAKESLTGEVIVLWTNALRFGLRLDISLVHQHAAKIFSEDWDTWIYSDARKYCVEVYHEGEICYSCLLPPHYIKRDQNDL